MGIMSAITGNAGEITAAEATQVVGQLLIQNEQIYKAYQVGRDTFVFTDKRVILVDRQGLVGSKTEYRTIPYRSITNYSVETAGPMDLDAELKIWIASAPLPITKEFNKKVNVYEVQNLLAQMILR